MSLPPYSEWEKKYRSYADRGIHFIVAWHMTNKHFGMDGDGWKEYEKEITELEREQP
jgi:hypothetical protein